MTTSVRNFIKNENDENRADLCLRFAFDVPS